MDQRPALQAHSAEPGELVLLLPVHDKSLTYLFTSDDTWKRWAVPLVLNAVAPVPGKPGEWLGAASPIEGKLSGLVRSVNGGRTWVEIGEDSRLRMIRTLIFHPGTGALLLGSVSEGVLESPDLGKTLIERGEGLGIDNVCSIAVDPRAKERIYAGTRSGLYRSGDGGRNWKWASRGLTALQCTGVHAFPGNRILLVSENGGVDWTPLETPQRFAIAKGMVVTEDRRLLLAANGSLRILDLSSLDD